MEEIIAVIDTETNWYNRVMSIGVLIANYEDYSVKEELYYIITPEYLVGGYVSIHLI